MKAISKVEYKYTNTSLIVKRCIDKFAKKVHNLQHACLTADALKEAVRKWN